MGWSEMTMDVGWTWVFGGLVVAGLVLLGIVVARIVGGGLTPWSQARTAPESPSAVEQLAQRYARGEIDTAQYEERLRHLRGA